MNAKRAVAYVDDNYGDDTIIGTVTGRAPDVRSRSPKSNGKFRVEWLRIEVDGETWEFKRPAVCVAEADDIEARLAVLVATPGWHPRQHRSFRRVA